MKNIYLSFLLSLLFLASCSIEPHTQVSSSAPVVLSGSTQTGALEKTIDLTGTTQSGTLTLSGAESQSGTLSISGSLTLSGSTTTATGEIKKELTLEERILLKLNDTIIAQTQKPALYSQRITLEEYGAQIVGSEIKWKAYEKISTFPLALQASDTFLNFQSISPQKKYILYDLRTASGTSYSQIIQTQSGQTVLTTTSSISCSVWDDNEDNFYYGFGAFQKGELGLYVRNTSSFGSSTLLEKDVSLLALVLEDETLYALVQSFPESSGMAYSLSLYDTKTHTKGKSIPLKQVGSRFEF